MPKQEIDNLNERFKLQLKGKKIRYEKQQPVDNDIFSFKKVGPKGLAHIRHVKSKADDLYSWLLENVQNNRERSLAITKLEETVMWLNKAISRSEYHD